MWLERIGIFAERESVNCSVARINVSETPIHWMLSIHSQTDKVLEECDGTKETVEFPLWTWLSLAIENNNKNWMNDSIHFGTIFINWKLASSCQLQPVETAVMPRRCRVYILRYACSTKWNVRGTKMRAHLFIFLVEVKALMCRRAADVRWPGWHWINYIFLLITSSVKQCTQVTTSRCRVLRSVNASIRTENENKTEMSVRLPYVHANAVLFSERISKYRMGWFTEQTIAWVLTIWWVARRLGIDFKRKERERDGERNKSLHVLICY